MLLYKNKKAYFDYEIIKEFTTGIVLNGGEVKSCRAGQVNFNGAYISFLENKVILKSATIAKYKYDQSKLYDDKKDRVLLLNEREIDKIKPELKNIGLTIIPLEVFTIGSLIKIKIALAKGKKNYDKRETIKKRELDRRK